MKKIYEIALRHAKERLALKIPVKDVMTLAVIAIKEDSDINEAARILSEGNVSGLPVVDNGKQCNWRYHRGRYTLSGRNGERIYI